MHTKQLQQTWRWFGPNDPVSLRDIKQAGVHGIVTALHHIPHGEVWTKEEINKRIDELKAGGFEWSVVESLTVHENIKTRSGNYAELIEKYKQSLANLAACGVKIVTYNFMPVNDWTRTDINYTMPNGSKALYFNWSDLALFDIHILQRKNAEKTYPAAIIEKAAKKNSTYTAAGKEGLVNTILFGIPGEEKRTTEGMRKELEKYKDIDRAALKSNLAWFLQQVAPAAAELGIQLAIHPDDPPFDILGLPRIACLQQDFLDIISYSATPSNGICFCTGSLGANPANDLPAMIRELGSRIHFAHLRNTKRDEEGNFYEADHLDGDTDMYAVMKALLTIQQQAAQPIPFRPDHGHQMLDDLNKTTNPGYSAIGRLRGLAELRGLELGIVKGVHFN
ncbi:mannonate dehydratase [Agriterribacter sp.]|uniref:mannonate dehydratase n=1 Tax=Agriterribacter sp. TaxID=2821509 RepID=UPI002B6F66D5|nr:mannonate dehydratase [Agriterribacter sp.]HTN09200.1 mannonate dehydratase [Agriterribacter sp.]